VVVRNDIGIFQRVSGVQMRIQRQIVIDEEMQFASVGNLPD
jgi:hypothetical protein